MPDSSTPPGCGQPEKLWLQESVSARPNFVAANPSSTEYGSISEPQLVAQQQSCGRVKSASTPPRFPDMAKPPTSLTYQPALLKCRASSEPILGPQLQNCETFKPVLSRTDFPGLDKLSNSLDLKQSLYVSQDNQMLPKELGSKIRLTEEPVVKADAIGFDDTPLIKSEERISQNGDYEPPSHADHAIVIKSEGSSSWNGDHGDAIDVYENYISSSDDYDGEDDPDYEDAGEITDDAENFDKEPYQRSKTTSGVPRAQHNTGSKRPHSPEAQPPKIRQKPAKDAFEAHMRKKLKVQEIEQEGKHTEATRAQVIGPIDKTTSKKRKVSALTSELESEKMILSLATTTQFTHAHESGNSYVPVANFQAATKKSQFDKLLEHSKGNKRRDRKTLRDLKEATKRFGRGNMKACDGKWALKGLKTPLYHYQVIGVDFMLSREFANEGEIKVGGPSGGFLCDKMGLGKTLQVLATTVANPPRQRADKHAGQSLIVAPTSVISQWKSECTKHFGEDFEVIVYKSSQKHGIHTLTNSKIVLAAYEELAKSCPYPMSEKDVKEIRNPDHLVKKEILKERRKKNGQSSFTEAFGKNKIATMCSQDDETTSIEKWIQDKMDEAGFLHQLDWHRIVLDEAHLIKNHLGRTSLAASALKGRYRWVVTGTPIMNRPEELFAYFRFLKSPGITSFFNFQGKYCAIEDEECRNALESELFPIIIRMQNEFLGKPLVSLPKAHEVVLKPIQAPGERVLYKAVERRLAELRKEQFTEGDPRETLKNMLFQLGVLRQLTSNPLIVEDTIKLIFDAQQLGGIRKTMSKIQTRFQDMDMTMGHRLDIWIAEKENKKPKSEIKAEDAEQYICCLCFGDLNEPHYLPCKHVYCHSCIDMRMGEQIDNGFAKTFCPECKKEYNIDKLRRHNVKSYEGKDRISTAKNKTKGRDARLIRPVGFRTSRWLDEVDDGEAVLLQSAKMLEIKKQLAEWTSKAPTEKIVIFSLSRMFCTVIGRMLNELKIKFVYYTGDFSTDTKDKTVSVFKEKSDIKVMVAGLMCAGLGLNLQFANRVISVDPWWNDCMESQAFGRVYRIGQERETYFAKTIVQGSIDSRMHKLQKRKTNHIKLALQELDIQEMENLLGRIEQDQDGKIRLCYDNDADDEPDPYAYMELDDEDLY
ncbi:hypothetical protein BP6252_04621 [Coleophoma cylindrospora]|uniref:Uncharacterized protein n=1 Tax=Coleophoma cylindrospora TaxID=1849047 RepID=A0A3D8S0Z4_9HELO|nr:hypothetical protein BP6252_04621 [Coleophoma cylindrospora]